MPGGQRSLFPVGGPSVMADRFAGARTHTRGAGGRSGLCQRLAWAVQVRLMISASTATASSTTGSLRLP